MPKIWDATVSGHREVVRNAILDGVTEVVHRNGLAGVSMSDVAQTAGIGRATLYKYFPDLDAVLDAWHHRIVQSHLRSLEVASAQHQDARARLRAVLQQYALLQAGRPADENAAGLHSTPHVRAASAELHALFVRVLDDAVATSAVTTQLPTDELAVYCEHALSAAADLPSHAAIGRLIDLVIESIAPAPHRPLRNATEHHPRTAS